MWKGFEAKDVVVNFEDMTHFVSLNDNVVSIDTRVEKRSDTNIGY
jgi:hypothetical protein